MPPGDSSRCCFHDNEPIFDDAYLVCFECGHVYASPDDLVREYHQRVSLYLWQIDREHMEDWSLDGAHYQADPEKIDFCAFCGHDF